MDDICAGLPDFDGDGLGFSSTKHIFFAVVCVKRAKLICFYREKPNKINRCGQRRLPGRLWRSTYLRRGRARYCRRRRVARHGLRSKGTTGTLLFNLELKRLDYQNCYEKLIHCPKFIAAIRILHPCMTEFIYRIYITLILYLIKINYFFFFFPLPFLPFFFFGFHAIPRWRYASKSSLQISIFFRKILP